jgi:hypothetical protein
MSRDLVKFLREPVEFQTDHQIRRQRLQAADRIEELSFGLVKIYACLHGKRNINERALEAINIVRTALKGEKKNG